MTLGGPAEGNLMYEDWSSLDAEAFKIHLAQASGVSFRTYIYGWQVGRWRLTKAQQEILMEEIRKRIPDTSDVVLSHDKARAFKTLTNYNRQQGWLAPVTITVSVGINQNEAITQVVEALNSLGIEARRGMRGDAG